jgi:hypothetical protein
MEGPNLNLLHSVIEHLKHAHGLVQPPLLIFSQTCDDHHLFFMPCKCKRYKFFAWRRDGEGMRR